MLAAISINNAAHQREHGAAIAEGLRRHDIKTAFVQGDIAVERADFHVTWSIKRPTIFDWRKRTGRSILIMERGHLPDRMRFTSCGWNGLARRGAYPRAQDGGARWRTHFAHLMRDWRRRGDYALVMGQVPGDSALWGLPSFEAWAASMALRLYETGRAVRYRPHPIVARDPLALFHPPVATLCVGTSLADDLAGAALVVTYNSTAGVEAVLAGVPTVTMDPGAMAWPVTTHAPEDVPATPDRAAWAHDLAWAQWTLDELASGEAWAHIAEAMPGPQRFNGVGATACG